MVTAIRSDAFGPQLPGPTDSSYRPGLSLAEVAAGRGVLARGDSGDGVRLLQSVLNLNGANPPLEEDGDFGPLTERAMQDFQSSLGFPFGDESGTCGLGSLIPLLLGASQNTSPNGDAFGKGSGIGPSNGLEKRAPSFGATRPADAMTAGAMQRDHELARNVQRANIPGGPAQTQAPWISQFDGSRVDRAGNAACYRACRAMSAAAGVPLPENTSNRIQVATGEDRYGRVTTTPQRTEQARNYIDRELAAGRPVAAGVSHKGGYGGNRDGITDHFVLITGRGSDQNGNTYYTYNEPATRDAERGDGNSATNRRTGGNRFYVDAKTGNLVHDGTLASGYVKDRRTELAMIVPRE